MRRYGVQKLHTQTKTVCKCGSTEIKFVDGKAKCASCDKERVLEAASQGGKDA